LKIKGKSREIGLRIVFTARPAIGRTQDAKTPSTIFRSYPRGIPFGFHRAGGAGAKGFFAESKGNNRLGIDSLA